MHRVFLPYRENHTMIFFDGSTTSQKCNDENENPHSNEEIGWSGQLTRVDETDIFVIPSHFGGNSNSNQNSSNNLHEKIKVLFGNWVAEICNYAISIGFLRKVIPTEHQSYTITQLCAMHYSRYTLQTVFVLFKGLQQYKFMCDLWLINTHFRIRICKTFSTCSKLDYNATR